MRRITAADGWISTPSSSSTSALPQRVLCDRFPCFAMRTPAPAAASAAAVEMLNVEKAPPPVPHVSTSVVASASSNESMAFRSARAPPATSCAVSPFTASATSSAPTCDGVPSPRMMMSKAFVVSSAVSEAPETRRRIASVSALPGTGRLPQPARQLRLGCYERDDESEQSNPLHILFHEHTALNAIRQIEHSHKIVVIHDGKADE